MQTAAVRYVATGPMKWEGVLLERGDPIPSGPALLRNISALLSTGRVVAASDFACRWVCEHPFFVERQWTHGDVLPENAPSWSNFKLMRDRGWVRPATDDELEAVNLEPPPKPDAPDDVARAPRERPKGGAQHRPRGKGRGRKKSSRKRRGQRKSSRKKASSKKR